MILNKVALIGMNGFMKMFWQKVKTNIVLKGQVKKIINKSRKGSYPT